MNIFKGSNFLCTKRLDIEIHIKKPTNRQAYVHTHSYHPPGTSKGVAIGEMIRTNSRVESFYNFSTKHKHNLCKRGYPTKFINRFTNTVQFADRLFQLKPKNTSRKMKRVAFITRYTPSADKAMKIIRKFWSSPQKTNLFKHTNIYWQLLPSLSC